MGEIHGEVASKWQYKIRNGKMIYEFESDVKIDDEILKAELGSNGEVQLKNIIRTIQKEQKPYPKYQRQDHGDPGCSRKRENFRGASQDRLSSLP